MWIVHDTDGRVLRTQTNAILLPGEAAFEMQAGALLDEDEVWVEDGTLRPRPAALLPAEAPAGVVLDLGALPPETPLTVRNEAGQEGTATAGEGVTLADPGRYRIRAEPAFPWQVVDHEIEVV